MSLFVRRPLLSALLTLCLLILPSTAWSFGTSAEALATREAYGPGTFDFQLTVGLGTFLSPEIEPAFDLGLIPLGENTTMSLGAGVGLGYCLGCHIFDVLTTLRVRAWNADPYARVLFHFNGLRESLGIPELDVYAGILGGPSYYRFSIRDTQNNVEANQNIVTLGGGLMGGLHYLLSESFFLGLELRYVLSVGLNTGELRVGENTYDFDYGTYVQNGMSYTFHLGFRF